MRAGLSIGAASALPGAARAAIAPQAAADRVIVTKTERRLYLLRDGEILRSYRVALGRVPKGTKIYQGDGRTPEGDYTLTEFNAGSRFYRSIRVSYPNEQDRARARALGQTVGGDVMLHGLAPERRDHACSSKCFGEVGRLINTAVRASGAHCVRRVYTCASEPSRALPNCPIFRSSSFQLPAPL